LLFNLVPEREDSLQGFEGGASVIVLLGFGELVVRNETGVFFAPVIALGTIAPAFREAFAGPIIVGAAGEQLGELKDALVQYNMRGIDRIGLVTVRQIRRGGRVHG